MQTELAAQRQAVGCRTDVVFDLDVAEMIQEGRATTLVELVSVTAKLLLVEGLYTWQDVVPQMS